MSEHDNENEIEIEKARVIKAFRTELRDLLEQYNAELDIDIDEGDEEIESVKLLCDIHIDDDVNAYSVVLAVGNIQFENIGASDIYLPSDKED